MSLEHPREKCRCPWCGHEYDDEELIEMDPTVEFVCGNYTGETCPEILTREDLIGEWDNCAYDY